MALLKRESKNLHRIFTPPSSGYPPVEAGTILSTKKVRKLHKEAPHACLQPWAKFWFFVARFTVLIRPGTIPQYGLPYTLYARQRRSVLDRGVERP